jgi:hypothetical protein
MNGDHKSKQEQHHCPASQTSLISTPGCVLSLLPAFWSHTMLSQDPAAQPQLKSGQNRLSTSQKLLKVPLECKINLQKEIKLRKMQLASFAVLTKAINKD